MSVPSRRWQNSRSSETNIASFQSHKLSANVKNYLGLQAISCSLDTCPEGDTLSFSTSPKCISPPSTSCTPYSSSSDDTSNCKPSNTKNHFYYNANAASSTQDRYKHQVKYTNQDNRVIGDTCSDITRRLMHTKFKPTILLEDIPHEAPQTTQPPRSRKHTPCAPTTGRRNHCGISSAAKFRQQAFTQDFTDEIEIDADLDDINSYMMSVYMSDESSVYSKGTASTVSTSSSSLTSNRSRHRGASHKRRAHMKQAEDRQPQKESGFLKSMKESSTSFFVEGNWSPKYGWFISKKWDANPGGNWDEPNPIFDSEDQLVDI